MRIKVGCQVGFLADRKSSERGLSNGCRDCERFLRRDQLPEIYSFRSWLQQIEAGGVLHFAGDALAVLVVMKGGSWGIHR